MMSGLQYYLQYFTKLFVVISPLAIIALFVSMTAPFTPKERIQTAKIGTAVAYGAMLFFALTGKAMFEFLGITMGAFYIAGGVILLLIGLSMLRMENDSEEEAVSEEHKASLATKNSKADISIAPFGIPIICGPGCITAVVALQSQASNIAQFLMGLLAITSVAGLLYYLLLLSSKCAGWLTPAVLKLSYCLSGLILAALAVQMIVTGMRHSDIAILTERPAIVENVEQQ